MFWFYIGWLPRIAEFAELASPNSVCVVFAIIFAIASLLQIVCFKVPRDDLAFATKPFKIIMTMVEYSVVLFSIANHGKGISKNYNIHADLGLNRR